MLRSIFSLANQSQPVVIKVLCTNVLRVFVLCGCLLTGIATGNATAAPAQLAAGPMAGHRDARSVILWLQADATGTAQIEYWPEDGSRQRARSAPHPLRAETDFVAHVELRGLKPGTTYHYRVLLDGKAVPLPPALSFSTESLWQWRKHSFIAAQGHVVPDFKVAFGSCVYVNDPPYDRSLHPSGAFGKGVEIFNRIAAQRPDLMLWLGDNNYLRDADYASPSGMAYRYRHDRALPALQNLLRTGHHYAIWDDHDYGPNDSNSSFVYKGEALKLFQRYWANGSYGLPETPGIFRVVSLNDADFFLLDNRTHRDSDKLQDPAKTMLGAAQLRWLKNALLASTAHVKIIVSGGQMLKTTPAQYEGWSNFADERNGFFDWLAAQRVGGVLFLSGDRHHTVLTKVERPGTYPLYDFTCSPLTAGAFAPNKNEDMSNTDAGTVIGQRNFCSIDFAGAWNERRLVLKSFDAAGKELWQREISVKELAGAR